MGLIEIIKYLFQIRCLSAIAFLGLVLMIKTPDRALKQTGKAIALSASTGVVALIVQNGKLQEAEYAQQEKYLLELEQIQQDYKQREAALKTFLDRVMAESDMFKGRLAQMQAVLSADQNEKALAFGQLEVLEKEHRHVLYELQEMAIAAQSSAFIPAGGYSHSEVSQIQAEATARISELEATLAKRTQMATQMLTELETEATNTFNQFNAKVASQSEVIDSLYQQIASLKQTNAALTRQQLNRQIGSIGSRSISSNSSTSNSTFSHPSISS